MNTYIILSKMFFIFTFIFSTVNTGYCLTKYDLKSITDIPNANLSFYNNYLKYIESDQKLAIEYALKFLSNIDSTEMNPAIAQLNEVLSLYYSDELYLYSKAIKYQKRAFNIYKSIGDIHSQIKTESQLGRLYIFTGNNNQAFPLIINSLNLSKKLDDKKTEAKCNLLLGNIYYFSTDYNKAIEYYTKASNISFKTKDYYQLMLATNNIALSDLFTGNQKDALNLLNENLILCKQYGYRDLIFSTYNNLITIYIWKDRKITAELLDLSFEYISGIKETALYYSNLGLINQLNKEYPKAIEAYKKAIELYNQGELNNLLQEAYRNLYLVYGLVKDTTNAFSAIQNYYRVENMTPKRDILIDLYRSQNKINLNKEKELQQKSKIKHQLIIISIIISFAIFISFLTIHLKIKRLKNERKISKLQLEQLNQEKLQTDLERLQKETEFELNAAEGIVKLKRIQQHQMDVLVDGIIIKLREISLNTKVKDTIDMVNHILFDLKTSKNKYGWIEIEKFLPEINSKFYSHLIEKYPDLTVNERRLCTFLHLNLTTKEISRITNQSENTLTMARYRLRKKLNIICPNESIVAFLQKL